MPSIFDIVPNESFQEEQKKAKEIVLRSLLIKSRDIDGFRNNSTLISEFSLSNLDLLTYTAVFYIKPGESNVKELKESVSEWVADSAIEGNFIGFFRVNGTGKKKEFETTNKNKRKYTHRAIAVNVSFTHKGDYDLFENEFMVLSKLTDT